MVGKFKLKEALQYSKLKEQAAKKGSDKKPKPQKVQEESSDEEESEYEDDEEEEEEEEEHPLSKKDQRKLKKQLKKEQEEAEDSDDEEDTPKLIDTHKLVESDSESEFEEFEEFAAKKKALKSKKEEEDDDEDDDEDEDEDDVALSDAELDDDADVIPFQKLTVNNKPALLQALSAIQLPRGGAGGLKFFEHLSVTSAEPQASLIKDVFDDLERELSFYKQGLEAAQLTRTQLQRDRQPFSRPTDYFAEMVKSDEHMDKLKQKLVADETEKRARQDARRQRELKKFGKKVQHAKLQERQKDKRETLDKIQSLKRKRAGNEISSNDFDIAVEEAAAATSSDRGNRRGGPNHKRQAKNAKYGFGKKFDKNNDAESSGDVSGFNRSMRNKRAGGPGGPGGPGGRAPAAGKPRRPGKSKRQQGGRR